LAQVAASERSCRLAAVCAQALLPHKASNKAPKAQVGLVCRRNDGDVILGVSNEGVGQRQCRRKVS
jgi:hypothetical protein